MIYKKEKMMAIIPQDDLDAIRDELSNLKQLICEGIGTVEKRDNEDLLTTAQAAQKLHVTTRTLLKWRKSGIVKVSQVGRRIYYRKSEIDRLIENNRIEYGIYRK